MKGRARRWGVACSLVSLLVFGLGTVAWAQTDGPTPPEEGDPVGSDVSPHGGYDSTSNFCLQCHEVHKAGGEYALLWKGSVTATCATCHGLNGAAATGTRDPVGPGTIGTAAARTAYDVASPSAEHDIGSSSPPGETGITITQSDWAYHGWPTTDATTPAGAGTASDVGGGLYCASCHAPHGTYGQVVNNWVKPVDSNPSDEGTSIAWNNPTTGSWATMYLDWDGTNGAWRVCPTAGDVVSGDAFGAACTDYAQVKDAEGQLVSLYGYKLLSAYPNHSYSTVKSYNAEMYAHDGMVWCGTCHPSRVDTSYGGTYHNHPTGCTACHGNPADASSSDFPHTSTFDNLLKNYPDALCVTCHRAGTLP